MSNFAIAIDGPAGSGKSTVAKRIAKILNIIYVDTGAMYRAVALFCLRNGISFNDENTIISNLEKLNISFMHKNNEQRIFLDDEDVTDLIRTQDVGRGSSIVAGIFDVREKLVDIQKKIAEDNSVIMDGRDIGTNVLPMAKYKYYINASVDERTKRRCGELEKRGEQYNIEEVRGQIIERDYNDMNRKYNPLKKADDAEEIDTTKMSIENVVDIIVKKVKEPKNMEIL